MRVCTIVARNYLAMARVLASSLERLEAGPALSVFVLDDEGDTDSAEAVSYTHLTLPTNREV